MTALPHLKDISSATVASVSLDLLIRAQTLQAAWVKYIPQPGAPVPLIFFIMLFLYLRRMVSFLATADLAERDVGWNSTDPGGSHLGALITGGGGSMHTVLGFFISSVELRGSYQESQPHTSLARPPDKLPTLARELPGSVLSILVMRPFSATVGQPTPSYECLSWGPQNPRETPEIKRIRLWAYTSEFPHAGEGSCSLT